MKNLNAVRWAAFLMTLLANADVAEAKMMVDHPTSGPRAKCERCGQTGPTVPEVPVVFRVRPTVGFTVPQGHGNASLGPALQNVRSNSAVPVRDEFGLDSENPAVGAVFTR
jgi:hypothetical protein